MDVLKYIEEIDISILWPVMGLVLLIFAIKVKRKIRDRRLIETVTSLNRGTKSERDLILRLLKHGIPAETIFHDLCVEKNNGKFSQIDIVVVTIQGIIVFEVKDYSGWIFGNGNYSHWTKVLAYGKKKYRFYNPIKQNNSHIKVLRKQLRQFENIPFFSMIVFYGDCELKEINFVPEGTYLVKRRRIFEVLKLIEKNNIPALYIDKQEVFRTLQLAVMNGAIVQNQEKHIEDIKDMLGKHRIFD